MNFGRVRRPLPVTKALDDVLVACEMNGAELPVDHGYPARLVVPGWVGIASIRWLGSVEVSETSLHSPWDTEFYRVLGPSCPAAGTLVTTQVAKSAFELSWDATLPAGRRLLTGRARAPGGVRRVGVHGRADVAAGHSGVARRPGPGGRRRRGPTCCGCGPATSRTSRRTTRRATSSARS
ncbi:molybdopterin-dependent oxidoreductase-like protein [Lentzea atacamensis]|uniref:Molybdopterin-dependent oxidoreductase-like protein n=1 Tax=Lentzea atacamensis TaxID=531938 RepID=A0A316HXN1_9PSEU|nr:molybdopterin-dependent oxidoreductase [Lentzea atacamensis]PWK85476.1 molybdopterin-dependent oxidoreductase-like protein [Lentzea atacamensis]